MILADLRPYLQHLPTCWLRYETRTFVPNPPYTPRFRQDGDPEPTCDCGLSALLTAREADEARLRALVEQWRVASDAPGAPGDGPWEAGEAYGRRQCADDLAALLGAASPEKA